MPQTVILLRSEAPAKPPVGQACNGCGVCCAAEPCPLGMLLSRRRSGACVALRWTEADRRYHCDVVAAPRRWLRVLAWLPEAASRRLALRWIGAGRGCDASLQAERPQG